MNSWLTRRYGSRRGFVRTFWHRFLNLLGRYRKYRQVDWQSIERLVFICKGNICRSAYAEVVARSLGLPATSCGLDTVENAPANEAAGREARKRGYSLDEHKTTPIMCLSIRNTDLLVAMEPWQVEFLEKHQGKTHNSTLLGLWTKPALPYIHDPYGSSSYYFEKCFSDIEKAVHGLARMIKQ